MYKISLIIYFEIGYLRPEVHITVHVMYCILFCTVQYSIRL